MEESHSRNTFQQISYFFEQPVFCTAVYSSKGQFLRANSNWFSFWDISPQAQGELQKTYNIFQDPQLLSVSDLLQKGFGTQAVCLPTFEYLPHKSPFALHSQRRENVWLQGFILPFSIWFPEETEEVFIIYKDISSYQLIKEHLKDAHQKLQEERYIFVSGPSVIFKWKNAPRWPVEYVSPNVEDVLGYSAQEFIEGKIDYAQLIDPNDLERVGQEVQEASSSGQNNFEHQPYRVFHKSGKTVWLYDVSSIIRDEMGQISHYLGYVTNITERKLAEEKHRTLTEDVLDVLEVGIFIVDSHQKIVWTNQTIRKFFGFSREALLEKNQPEFFSKILKPCFEESESFTLASQEQYTSTNSQMQIIGHFLPQENLPERWFQYKRQAISKGLYAGGYVELYYDITSLKQTEESRKQIEAQLLHSQKLESLGILAGGIAHDFNNLLTGILGNAGLIRTSFPTESPLVSALKDIETAAIRAADLCRQMLAYSGKGKFLIQPLNLNQIIQEMTHLLEVSISKNIVLKYHLFSELPLIEADGTQLRQIIMNLLTNASDAIGTTPGMIHLTTGKCFLNKESFKDCYFHENLVEGEYVFAEVTDTGYGFDEETEKRIFDPFFTTKFAGRGLGLAVVLGIIRGHRGTIKVKSVLKKGSSFTIYFPALQASSSRIVSPPIEEKSLLWKKGSGTILVIDDEQTVRNVSQRTLETVGFHVLVARNGQEGFHLFQKKQTEILLVLLDLTMPQISGLETFSLLKTLRPDIPILFSSGYNEEEISPLRSTYPFVSFIQKPYTPVELIDAIQKLIEF